MGNRAEDMGITVVPNARRIVRNEILACSFIPILSIDFSHTFPRHFLGHMWLIKNPATIDVMTIRV